MNVFPYTRLTALACGVFASVENLWAGPPFVTDDPVPVDYKNWAVYLSTTLDHGADGWDGAFPLMEINYGALPDLQLHLQVTNSFTATVGDSVRAGFGDTELGFKYRFVAEATARPQISFYPLVEIPSGDRERGLGSGHTDLYLPFWMQKGFGKWTVYGGGGYWFNPGPDNRNWCFSGIAVQRKISERFVLGGELFHQTAKVRDGTSTTFINGGAIWEWGEHWHFLFSTGHTIQGRSELDAYLGLQITFGPEKSGK